MRVFNFKWLLKILAHNKSKLSRDILKPLIAFNLISKPLKPLYLLKHENSLFKDSLIWTCSLNQWYSMRWPSFMQIYSIWRFAKFQRCSPSTVFVTHDTALQKIMLKQPLVFVQTAFNFFAPLNKETFLSKSNWQAS